MRLFVTVVNSLGKFVGEIITLPTDDVTETSWMDWMDYLSNNINKIEFLRFVASDGSAYLITKQILLQSVINFKLVDDNGLTVNIKDLNERK